MDCGYIYWGFMQVINHIFSPLLLGNFDGLSADGDGATDRLPDGSTDKSDDVWMEGNSPRIWTFRKCHPAILMGISTIKFANGWMDGMDDRHTERWMDFQVESHLA